MKNVFLLLIAFVFIYSCNEKNNGTNKKTEGKQYNVMELEQNES